MKLSKEKQRTIFAYYTLMVVLIICSLVLAAVAINKYTQVTIQYEELKSDYTKLNNKYSELESEYEYDQGRLKNISGTTK